MTALDKLTPLKILDALVEQNIYLCLTQATPCLDNCINISFSCMKGMQGFVGETENCINLR